ncbi:sigma-70 family RNA polymerase sigma factor [Plantibacter flavus]|uniref:sigma-70 family RNA polymerase sigma factor n=1 Tax=Plantibacter flavus TaxID=150123 RepID=UPI003F18FADD
MSLDVTPRSSLAERSDSELIDGTRAGSQSAYAELWRRHASAGRTVARSVTSSIDPDDLVSESFARIYQAVARGKGPTGAFRPYLFTTIRNTAAAWGRARRETSLDTLDSFEDPDTNEASSMEALDRSLSARAFRSLPTRWQEVLWYTEIEGMTPADVAPLLGMKANSVSALAYRAREGLREAWIQAHLQSVDDDSEHAFTISRLGAYARGNLAARDTAKLEAHLDVCQRCTIVAAEAKDVGSRMALVLLPLVAGSAGAAGYTAWLQASGHATATAVAMPASVTGSTVLAGHIGAHASGAHAASAVLPDAATHLGAHAVGATTLGAHVGGGHAASGGALAGVGTAGASVSGGLAGAGSSGGTAGAGAGAGAGATVAAAGTAAGVATAGLSGGIIAAIVTGVVIAGTAAALVVGPMVFPQSPDAGTSAVAEDTAPAGPAPMPPSAGPTTPGSRPTPTPTAPAPAPAPAPVADQEGASESVDSSAPASDPVPTTPATPPVVPTPKPTEPTGPVDPNGPNTTPSVPVVSSTDTGDGRFWPILTGTAPAGATIDILDSNGRVVASTTAVPAPAARTTTVAPGTWSTGPIELSQAGAFTFTVQQTLAGVVTTAAAPVTGTVGSPVVRGLSRFLGIWYLDRGDQLTVTGVPGATVRASLDDGPEQLVTIGDTGRSAPIEGADELGTHVIRVSYADPADPTRGGPTAKVSFISLGASNAEAPVDPTTSTTPAEEDPGTADQPDATTPPAEPADTSVPESPAPTVPADEQPALPEEPVSGSDTPTAVPEEPSQTDPPIDQTTPAAAPTP